MRVTPDREALEDQLFSLGRRLGAHAQRAVGVERQRLAGLARHSFFRDPMFAVRFGRERMRTLSGQFVSGQRLRLRAAAGRLERLAVRLETNRPSATQARMAVRLRDAEVRLGAALRARVCDVDVGALRHRLSRAWCCLLEARRLRLDGLDRQLGAVGPVGVLRRGFSVTSLDDGTLVRSVGDARPGSTLHTRLAGGTLRSVVAEAGASDGTAPAAPRVARPSPRRGRKGGEPPQLDLFAPRG
jgi:exonuclease VII large subunit